MTKSTVRKIALSSIAALVIVYGWNMFEKLSYNRMVGKTNILSYVPSDVKTMVYFDRNYYLDEYCLIDPVNSNILNIIKDHITYPLIIVKTDNEEDVFITRATKEQELALKELLNSQVLFNHSPVKRKCDNSEICFYTVSDGEFLAVTFCKGIFAVSKNYKLIENLCRQKDSNKNYFVRGSVEQIYYTEKMLKNMPITFLCNTNDTNFVLTYTNKAEGICFEGEYFGRMEVDSVKLGCQEIDSICKFDRFFVDSISWEEKNKVKIWIKETNSIK